MGKLFLTVLVSSWLLSVVRGFCEDANPPIYLEVIPTSSGLPHNPATDVQESFEAPNGKTVEVLAKGPIGVESRGESTTQLYEDDRGRVGTYAEI